VRRFASLVAGVAVLLAACSASPGGGGTTTSSAGSTTPTTSTPPPTSTTPPTAAALCAAGAPQQVGTVSDPQLDEVSGVVQSRAHAGVLWVHNDSGDSARVFAINETGATLGQYLLDGATAVDWEDIALDGTTLYLGDIGDNAKARADVVVYSVAEPSPTTVTASLPATAQHLVYPDGAHDAEALLVDPVTHDLFVVTKELTGQSAVYRHTTGTTLVKVATLDLGVAQLVTGGDIAADGSAIVLRTYGAVFVWSRRGNESIADAFGRAPCSAPAPRQQQGEAIGLDPNGRGYVLLSEGTNQPVWHVAASTG
jgi:hypothetical protein